MLFLHLTEKFFKQFHTILGVDPKLALERDDFPFPQAVPKTPSDYWQLINDYNIDVDFNVVAEIMKLKAARKKEDIKIEDALDLFEESRRKHWFVDDCELVEYHTIIKDEYCEFIGGFLNKDAMELDPDLYDEIIEEHFREWICKYSEIRTQHFKKLIRGIQNQPILDGTEKDPEPKFITGIDFTGEKTKLKEKFLEDNRIKKDSKEWYEIADKGRSGKGFHKKEKKIEEISYSDETNFIDFVERFFNQFASSIGIRDGISVCYLKYESPLLPIRDDHRDAILSGSRCTLPFNISAEILRIKMSMKKDEIDVDTALAVIESTRRIKWCSKNGNEFIDIHPLIISDLERWMQAFHPKGLPMERKMELSFPLTGDIFAGMCNDLQDDLIKERKEIYNQLIRSIKEDKIYLSKEDILNSTKLSVLKPKMTEVEKDAWSFGTKKDIEEVKESNQTSPEKESAEDFHFKNNFDHVDPKRVYDYFTEKLVKDKYLTEDVFRKYLITAFQDSNITKDRKEKDPIKKPFRFNGKISKTYIYETYRYYQIEIAGQETGTQARIAKLVGHYFSDFKTITVYGNLNNY